METLSFLAIYMLPSMIAWYRRKQGKSIVLPFRSLVFFNFFLGWTIVAWFLSLAHALGYNPVASVVPNLIRYLPSSGPVANVPQGGIAWRGVLALWAVRRDGKDAVFDVRRSWYVVRSATRGIGDGTAENLWHMPQWRPHYLSILRWYWPCPGIG